MKPIRVWSALIPILTVLAGCSSEPTKPKPAPSLAANDTPAHAVARLLGAYELRDDGDYDAMLTGDFTYDFSSASDPIYVQQYANGWFKADEVQSSSHLFHGFHAYGTEGNTAASKIDLRFANASPIADTTAGLDPSTHQVLATRVDGEITVHESGTRTELTFEIFNNQDVFYLVRGDSAKGLDASQPADSLHWYMYRWLDRTWMFADLQAKVPQSTWGTVKGIYR